MPDQLGIASAYTRVRYRAPTPWYRRLRVAVVNSRFNLHPLGTPECGARVAVTADEEVVPASELKAAVQRIKELERALGRKTIEVEILQAACRQPAGSLQSNGMRRYSAAPCGGR